MSRIRFNHVFIALVLGSAISAFVLPVRVTDRLRAPVQILFAPVSRPVHVAAAGVLDRISPERIVDEGTVGGVRREAEDVVTENQQLRLAVASLTGQLEELKRINADREALGDVRQLCMPVPVAGGDAGGRESLLLQRTGSPLRAGMPVLYSGGIAGRLEHAGAGGGRVRLVTDRGFRMTGSFGRFITTGDGRVEFVRIATPQPLVEGIGNGQMRIRNLPLEQVRSASLAAGDWLVLSDPDWPANLDGYRIGRVEVITAASDAPGFADVRLRPERELLRLREVMVMNRE
jgi:hypothetical protein